MKVVLQNHSEVQRFKDPDIASFFSWITNGVASKSGTRFG